MDGDSGTHQLAFLLAQPCFQACLLEQRQVLHKDLTVQVVDFMLHADRQQSFGVKFNLFACKIQGAHPHLGRAFDLVVDAGHGQTAFFVSILLIAFCNELRIDQDAQVVFLLADIDDNHPPVDINLGGSQTNARRFVHCFSHIGDEFADAIVHDADRLCDLVQARVRIMQDRKQSHEQENG